MCALFSVASDIVYQQSRRRLPIFSPPGVHICFKHHSWVALFIIPLPFPDFHVAWFEGTVFHLNGARYGCQGHIQDFFDGARLSDLIPKKATTRVSKIPMVEQKRASRTSKRVLRASSGHDTTRPPGSARPWP